MQYYLLYGVTQKSNSKLVQNLSWSETLRNTVCPILLNPDVFPKQKPSYSVSPIQQPEIIHLSEKTVCA